MTNRQPTPDIRSAAFIAAREKCAMSVEELAHLACLSKKQIQQIENGGHDAYYSQVIKLTAAKKVAQLIQLDEKDAFDFGPQAELPLTPVDELTQSELTSTEQAPSVDLKKEAPKKEVPKKEAAQADEGEQKEANKVVSQLEAKPILVEALKPQPSMRAHSDAREKKPAGKKWIWLLPVGALVLALVQFQPFLADQLDVLMGKPKPVEVAVLTAVPVDATPATPPAEPVSAPATATPQVAPAITPSPAVAVAANPACPPSDASIENYKSPSPSKPGNMVYIKVSTAQIVCVEDGDGKVQSKAMEPSLGHSFYGKPPFKLLTSGLSSAEVFFQGLRVRPSNADSKSIMLLQVDKQ